jgi:prephenate dehydrogenase
MQIGIIGLGLIGGSIALDLKDQLGVKVYGYDNSETHRKSALKLGLVHGIREEKELLESSDVIICAVPVHILEDKLIELLDQSKEDQIIIDTGSTKKNICEKLNDHIHRSRFVAAHPLAGTENSGPTAAHKGLFKNKKNIICDSEKSSEYAVEICKKIFKSFGMDSYELNSEEHDKHLAYVSHLSHVSAFMLGLTVLDLEKDEKQIAQLASTGFASTARLAKSSPETWGAIFDKNSKYVCEALEQYIEYLNKFLKLLKDNNKQSTIELMKEANEVRRILDGITTK